MKKNIASKYWKKYRVQKAKIKKDKSLDFFDKSNEYKALLRDTRKLISEDYSKLAAKNKERKFLKAHAKDEPFPGFKFSRKFETQHTKQEFLKVKQRNIQKYDTNQLDDIIKQAMNKPGVTGIGLVLKVEYKESGEIGHVSKFYTKLGIKRIEERGKTLYEDLSKKLENMGKKSTAEFKLKGIYIRIIYEKSS